jgi:hypothetical protein
VKTVTDNGRISLNASMRHSAANILRRGIPSLWSDIAEVIPIMEYIVSTYTTSHPLQLYGYDFYGPITNASFPDHYLHYLGHIAQLPIVNQVEFTSGLFIQRLIQFTTYQWAIQVPNDGNQTQWLSLLQTIESQLRNNVTLTNPDEERTLSWWIQLTRNVYSYRYLIISVLASIN